MLKKVKKKSKMGKNGWQVSKATVDIQECVQGHVDGWPKMWTLKNTQWKLKNGESAQNGVGAQKLMLGPKKSLDKIIDMCRLVIEPQNHRQ